MSLQTRAVPAGKECFVSFYIARRKLVFIFEESPPYAHPDWIEQRFLFLITMLILGNAPILAKETHEDF
ncbi:hypothetical protein [Oceanobacillus polygoni]|uniref:Uncharacterized protein n=1 Tax=Oceanobacillus polygoni TaxID=1235259 RepID=A0A9X1CEM6_9BACI|nr:hypothetical protein [Oceanobacillus polygoni]MBP2076288.1 hypothetical protein [Oceanobacillus polygoni]